MHALLRVATLTVIISAGFKFELLAYSLNFFSCYSEWDAIGHLIGAHARGHSCPLMLSCIGVRARLALRHDVDSLWNVLPQYPAGSMVGVELQLRMNVVEKRFPCGPQGTHHVSTWFTGFACRQAWRSIIMD